MQSSSRSPSRRGASPSGGRPEKKAPSRDSRGSFGRGPSSADSQGPRDRGGPGRDSAGHSSFGPGPVHKAKGAPVQRHLRNARNKVPANHGVRAKQYIDPAKFVKKAVSVERAEYAPSNRFEDFGLHLNILENVKRKGFTAPTAIQDQTIPLVLAGKDVVGLANTGTGKTAAFALPMIHDLVTHMDRRAIILAPTRELATQIFEECLAFAKDCGLRQALLIGGASMHLQTRDLRRNPRIVVGTPGRVKDHIDQGTILLGFYDFVVLDEVDRMLDMGFLDSVRDIVSRTKAERQSLFFSATMEPRIEQLIAKFAKSPVTVSTVEGSTADGVEQDIVYFKGSNDKIDKLHDVLIRRECVKTIIFDDTKRLVEQLGRELHHRGFKVDYIHGDKSQSQRQRAITRLKSGEVDVLVATDVAARGIDVSDVSHVINYSTPHSWEDYIHRIGRTARAGKTGYALTFLPAK